MFQFKEKLSLFTSVHAGVFSLWLSSSHTQYLVCNNEESQVDTVQIKWSYALFYCDLFCSYPASVTSHSTFILLICELIRTQNLFPDSGKMFPINLK